MNTTSKPDPQLMRALEPISVCQLADGLGPSCQIETGIRPIDPAFHVCGTAVTALCHPGENLTLHQALHGARPGDVLVVSGSHDRGLWGELMSLCAQTHGLKGTLIDGAARDPQEIKAMQYPVFSRHINPSKAHKNQAGHVNIPIRFGRLLVSPGDIVCADVNGIIAFPAQQLEEVVRKALEVAHKEEEVQSEIRKGRTTLEIKGLV